MEPNVEATISVENVVADDEGYCQKMAQLDQQRIHSDRDGEVFDSDGWPEFRTGLHVRRSNNGQCTLVFGLRADRPLPVDVCQLPSTGPKVFYELECSKNASPDAIDVRPACSFTQ